MRRQLLAIDFVMQFRDKTFKLKLRLFIIGLLFALFVVACQNKSVRQSPNPSLADCRTVNHVMGEACVPKTVQRLISLDDVTLADALTGVDWLKKTLLQ